MILALSHGVKYGARNALATALGNCTASFFQAVVSIAGLGALLAASETAFMIVKYAGAAYLIWIGIGMFFSDNLKIEDKNSSGNDIPSFKKRFMHGFWVAAGNPKAIVFFSALFPQFISADQAGTQHLALLLGLLSVIAFGCMMIYATGGSKLKDLFKGSAIGNHMNKVFGTSFVGLGVGLACSRR